MSNGIEAGSSAKLFLRDNQGRVLLLQRSRNSKWFQHMWDLPGGKVDPGESLEVTLRRELDEETGLACDALTVLGDRQFDVGTRSCSETLYSAYLVGPPEAHLSDEHEACRWVALESLGSEDIPLIPGLAEFAQDCKELHNDRR